MWVSTLLQAVHNIREDNFSFDLSFSTNTQKPESGYRNCQPQAFCSFGIGHASAIPLPSAALDGSEALLYPKAHVFTVAIFVWLYEKTYPSQL